MPIVHETSDCETYVIDKFAIPTLHCILGTVNRVYHYLEDNCPEVENFSRKLGIVRDPFNKKVYNGNYCEKILKNVTILEEKISQEFKPFITVLQCIQDVKESCFGPKLNPNYQVAIDNFEKAWYDIYIEFDIAFTNKCHVIIEHVPQVIQRTGESLFAASEQVVEATHAKFDKMWQRYKVVDMERESHGKQLLRCVVDFNSKNL